MSEKADRILARFQSTRRILAKSIANDNATNDNGPDDGGNTPGAGIVNIGLLRA